MDNSISILNDEAKLVVRAQTETAVFADIYDHYFPRIFSYTIYRLQNRQIADDITAHVFERALASLHKYDPNRGSFSAWLFTIARNMINNHMRAQRIRNIIPIDKLRHHPDPTENIENLIMDNEKLVQLMPLIAQLNERERDILALKFGAEFTNRRIAQIMNLSESNVGVILYRTIGRLRAQLQEGTEKERNYA